MIPLFYSFTPEKSEFSVFSYTISDGSMNFSCKTRICCISAAFLYRGLLQISCQHFVNFVKLLHLVNLKMELLFCIIII